MICTAIPMVPPILDRILFFYLLPPPRAEFLPPIEGVPTYELVSYAITNLVLVGLSILDWRSGRRLNAFPVVLGGFLALQALPVLVYRMTFWERFSEWFLMVPL